MIIKIIISVVLGIISGIFFLDPSFALVIPKAMNIGLCALLFFVGMDIGNNKGVFKQIRQMGFKVLGIPLVVTIMTLIGGILAGSLMGYSFGESGVIAGGMGWYSLSAVLVAPYSAKISAMAFLANVTREIFAIITIPIIAKYIGKLEAIGPTGAAGMDTLLPIVSKSTCPSTAIVCFINGFVLTVIVTILVPFFISLM
ncbi:MAG: lysine exporter LysO family protein [Filifactoraceae bacterium]